MHRLPTGLTGYLLIGMEARARGRLCAIPLRPTP